MKHHIRTLACGAAFAVMTFVACGGKQTIASKSAAAYDEAIKKGVPIAADEHGGHAAESSAEIPATTSTAGMDHGAMPGMDHSRMPNMDHSKMTAMDHGTMAGMDHAKMTSMDHRAMPGMDHSAMPGMQHGQSGSGAHHDMAGMDHSAKPGMDHSAMSGMQHGGSMPAMQHGLSTAPPMMIAPPTTNAAIVQTQPAATLRADEFDAPAPAAIEEAAKAASGMSHPAQPPQPPAEHKHDHGGGEGP